MGEAGRSSRLGSRAGHQRLGLRWRRVALGVLGLLAAGGPVVVASTADATGGSEVSNVTVTQSTPVVSAGSDYTVNFSTSSSGAMNPGATITLDFPTGTNATALTHTAVFDTTTGENQGGCKNSGGTTNVVVCDVAGSNAIGAGDAVVVYLDGVVNPSTPSTGDTVGVQTSADNGGPVASNAYAIVAGQTVSGVSVTQTQAATNSTSDYTITFTTSSSGGMAPGSGDAVTLIFPTNFNVDSLTNSGVIVGPAIGGSCASSGSTVTCPITNGQIGDGTPVEVRLDGVVNPPNPGTYPIGAETSADNKDMVDGLVAIGPGQAVSDVSVTQTSPVTRARSNYLVSFNVSSTGGLTAGDTATLTFPNGTDLTSLTSTEIGGLGNLAGNCANSSTATLTCTVDGSIASSSQVVVEADGVINPPTAGTDDSVGVETSIDNLHVVASTGFAITTAQAVSAVMVTQTNPTTGAPSTYTINFAVSSTGAMAGGAGATVMLAFPSGTDTDAITSGEMTDSGGFVASCPGSTNSTVTCEVDRPVADGDTLSVSLPGVINPPSAGTYTVSVLTSTDNLGAVSSNSYVLPNPSPIVTAVAPNSGPAAGGNTVTVLGSNLQNTSQVLFGGAVATGVTVNAAGTQLTAAVPPLSGTLPATVDVTVTTPFGSSTASPADHYEYLPAPTISGLSATSGSAGGGTSVTISGTGFLGAPVQVSFGTAAATVQMINAAGTQVTVLTPPSAVIGSVTVSVTTNGGTASKAKGFSYTRAVTHTTLQATPSSVSFGQAVTLTASVAPSPLGGTVRFTHNGSQLGDPVTVDDGVAQLTVALPVGALTVEAHYSGTTAFDASNGSAKVQVAQAPTQTRASPAEISGASATLRATLTSTVTNAPLSGLFLEFKAGSTVLCSVKTDASGTAVCTASTATKLADITKARGYTALFAGSTAYVKSSASAGIAG